MARPRKAGNRDLPPNLRVKKSRGHTYYRYEHPFTGEEHPLGKDREQAKKAAKVLNSKIDVPPSVDDLVSSVLGGRRTMAELLDHTDQLYFIGDPTHCKPYAQGTKDAYHDKVPRLRNELGARSLDDISGADITRVLDKMTAPNARNHRAVLCVVFKEGRRQGWMQHDPMEHVSKYASKSQRARMTMEQFNAVYDHPEAKPWLRNAMLLSLRTLQARKEICALKWEDVKQGSMRVMRQKTGARISINIGAQIKAALDECRSDVASPFVIHRRSMFGVRRQHIAGKEHWTQIDPDALQDEFRRIAMQCDEFAGLTRHQRPTFHEIRALGAKTYQAAGVPVPEIQKLMGHSEERMTQLYLARHEDHWVPATGM